MKRRLIIHPHTIILSERKMTFRFIGGEFSIDGYDPIFKDVIEYALRFRQDNPAAAIKDEVDIQAEASTDKGEN